jgi:SAM-dependent methyltransferase
MLDRNRLPEMPFTRDGAKTAAPLSFHDWQIGKMSFTLANVVPWGRSFDEYVAMFALSDADLRRRILGCGDGPASFNALLTRQGGQVLSLDPLYRFSTEEVRKRISETYADVLEQTRKNKNEFVWTSIKSVDELGRIRMAAMEEFLSDYSQGLEQGRYVGGELPDLPFADNEFDLAVCSHLLFLYSEQLSGDFHVAAIRELCRVANEVRVFPLLELGAKISRHLQAVTDSLSAMGYSVTIARVSYEFQRGGNQMIKIRGVEPGSAVEREGRATLASCCKSP